MKFAPAVAIAALLAAGVVAPAAAHHAVNAQFDINKEVPMTGTLVKLDNINPHAYWHFDVKQPNGQVVRWSLESLSPAALRRLGVSVREDIKPGQVYNFKISPPLKAGSTTGLLVGLTVKGKELKLVPQGPGGA